MAKTGCTSPAPAVPAQVQHHCRTAAQMGQPAASSESRMKTSLMAAIETIQVTPRPTRPPSANWACSSYSDAAGDAWLLEITESDAVQVARRRAAHAAHRRNPETIEINFTHTFALRDRQLVLTAYADKAETVMERPRPSRSAPPSAACANATRRRCCGPCTSPIPATAPMRRCLEPPRPVARWCPPAGPRTCSGRPGRDQSWRRNTSPRDPAAACGGPGTPVVPLRWWRIPGRSPRCHGETPPPMHPATPRPPGWCSAAGGHDDDPVHPLHQPGDTCPPPWPWSTWTNCSTCWPTPCSGWPSLPCCLDWRIRWPAAAAVATVLFCLAYGLSDEFHQQFVPGRFPGADDLAGGADTPAASAPCSSTAPASAG